MPAFWIGYTPLIERQHQLGMNHVQKLSESLTRMSASLPETPTLTMPDDEAIHEKYHIPMTADRLVTTHLKVSLLVEPEIIFPMQIELVYLVTETPSMKYRWYYSASLSVSLLISTSMFLMSFSSRVGLTINTRRLPGRLLTFRLMSATCTVRFSPLALVY